MARNDDDDQTPEPEGGKAAARQRQFLEARGLASDQAEDIDEDEDDDTGRAGQDTGHGDQARDDRNEDGG
jgi:hypothetical protein